LDGLITTNLYQMSLVCHLNDGDGGEGT